MDGDGVDMDMKGGVVGIPSRQRSQRVTMTPSVFLTAVGSKLPRRRLSFSFSKRDWSFSNCASREANFKREGGIEEFDGFCNREGVEEGKVGDHDEGERRGTRLVSFCMESPVGRVGDIKDESGEVRSDEVGSGGLTGNSLTCEDEREDFEAKGSSRSGAASVK